MAGITAKDIKTLERLIARSLNRCARLEQRVQLATNETAYTQAVNELQAGQSLIAEARKIVTEYYAQAVR